MKDQAPIMALSSKQVVHNGRCRFESYLGCMWKKDKSNKVFIRCESCRGAGGFSEINPDSHKNHFMRCPACKGKKGRWIYR